MPRLQILELPTEHNGDDVVTPFVLVVDQYQPQRVMLGIDQTEPPVADEFDGVAQQIGARAVLVFRETVEIPANEMALDSNSVPVRLRVEGDFAKFREQVEEEVEKAVKRGGRWAR